MRRRNDSRKSGNVPPVPHFPKLLGPQNIVELARTGGISRVSQFSGPAKNQDEVVSFPIQAPRAPILQSSLTATPKVDSRGAPVRSQALTEAWRRQLRLPGYAIVFAAFRIATTRCPADPSLALDLPASDRSASEP